MKGLSIEQKAKRYDEALEKSKRLYEQGTITESLCYVFPELAELEDEKVRKELIKIAKLASLRGDPIFGEKWDYKKWVAWLEKQGETFTKKDVDDAYIEGMAFAKNELEKQGEQKPAWSCEDETRLQACIDTLQANSLMGRVDTVMTNWLKSLKQRIGG